MFKIRNLFENLRKIQSGFASVDPEIKCQPKNDHYNGKNFNKRLGDIYGDELLQLQLLYENWVTKDTWLIKDEALPLLTASDPEKGVEYDSEKDNLLNEIWPHARRCVEQGLLKVINREEVPENWRSQPLEIYRWAKISRIPFPDVLASLMEFVATTVKYADENDEQINCQNNTDMITMKFDQERERVLGMALAILAAYPEKCRNSKGSVKADKIINIINQKGTHWLGNEELVMSSTAMKDLINKWLNTTTMQID